MFGLNGSSEGASHPMGDPSQEILAFSEISRL